GRSPASAALAAGVGRQADGSGQRKPPGGRTNRRGVVRSLRGRPAVFTAGPILARRSGRPADLSLRGWGAGEKTLAPGAARVTLGAPARGPPSRGGPAPRAQEPLPVTP